MRVLVTGATGFLGAYTLPLLLDRRHQVRCLVRDGSASKLGSVRSRIELVAGDVTEPASLAGAADGCEAIVHMTGLLEERPERDLTYVRVLEGGARNLRDEARRAGVKRVIFTSTYGARFKDATGFRAANRHAEAILRDGGFQRLSILRLNYVFGDPGPGREDALLTHLRIFIDPLPVLLIVGDGLYRVQPVHVADVAAGILAALEHTEPGERIYDAVGPRAVTWLEFLDAIAVAAGRGSKPRVHLRASELAPYVARFRRMGLTKFDINERDRTGDASGFSALVGAPLIPFAASTIAFLQKYAGPGYSGPLYPWHKLSNQGETLRVDWGIEDEARYWPAAVLRDAPLRCEWTGSNVLLTGPGSNWMYAHAAACASAAGAAGLAVGQPNEPRPIPVPLGAANSSSPPWLRVVTLPGDWQVARFVEAAQGQRWPAVVEGRLGPFPPGSRVLVFGRGANWMYAACAAHATLAGAARIACFNPREGGMVTVWPAEMAGAVDRLPAEWRRSLGLPPTAAALLLGIAGDPNCGKTVLSYALDFVRMEERLVGWRLDCDGMSPTPPWYRDLVATGRGADAEITRREQKRAWTTEMEQQVARQLANVRDSFADVIVADLPGGYHPKDGSAPQRIPAGRRERLFHEVDEFILVGRTREHIMSWYEELSRLGLSDRILATLLSEDPTAPPGITWSSSGDRPWDGCVRGLDRQRAPAELLEGLRTPLGDLVQWALASAPRESCFLNVSNHAISSWSPAQMEGARALGLGEPRDLPEGMPQVPPGVDQAEVVRLAQSLARQAAEIGARGAFVAGEFTLTHAVVSQLQAGGIRCFAATTERHVDEDVRPDGSIDRRSVFRFVRWREYTLDAQRGYA